MSKGTFVVFEGGEGAGKSTQARLLFETLHEAGQPTLLTHEPGATPLGQRIRHLLLMPEPELQPGELPRPAQLVIPPMAEMLLYAADRATHVEHVIRPALERGEVVVCDRYVDSSVAYQGGGRGLQQVLLVSEIATGFLQPDLVVLLDIDPRIGLARIRDRGGADRIEAEQLEFHQRVRAGFLARATAVSVAAGARHRRYMVVDATQPVEVIAAQVKDRVSEILFQRIRGRVSV